MSQRKATENDVSLDMLPLQVHLDPGAVDDFVNAHGITLVHWKSMRCPIGLKSRTDVRRTDEDHSGCSNGFIYTLAGKFFASFGGNNSKLTQYDPGLLTGATVTITPPRFYLDKPDKSVLLLPFDRLYLEEESIVVHQWELFEAHEMGVDKFRFPIVEVIDLVDNLGRRYDNNDFRVQDGKLFWSGTNRPGVDADTGKGRVCVVRYSYRPFFYVQTLLHEIRVATVEALDGSMQVVRMPQSALLQREFFFEKSANDPAAPPSNRQGFGPPDGGFSAR